MNRLVKYELDNYLKMREKELTKHNYCMEVNLANKVLADQLDKTIDEFSTKENVYNVYSAIINGDLNVSYKQRSVVLLRKFTQFLHFSPEKEAEILKDVRPYSPSRKRSVRKRVLTQKEYELLLTKTKNPMDKVFIKLIYYFGIGIQDLVVIKWEAISLSEKKIKIAPQWRKRLLTDIHTITTFDLPDDLCDDLAQYKDVSYKSDWLFPSLIFKGMHAEEKTFRNRLRKYGWMIGVEEDIDAYSIAQVRLNTKIMNLINQDVLAELKQTYNLTEIQILRKYESLIGGKKDAV